MELRHLTYLIALAEERSFVAAAAKLGLAQPALSRQIHDLEEQVGGVLFVRDTRGARLTAAGEACVRAARTLLDDVKRARERARLADRGMVGKIVVASSCYPLYNGTLGRLVELVREEYPGIDVVIEERSLDAQWRAVTSGEVDIAIGSAPSPAYTDLAAEAFAHDVLDTAMVAPTHPLASRESVTLAELERETWIRYAPNVGDHPTRLVLEEFQRRGFAPQHTRNVAMGSALRMLVRAGAGWSALPHTMRGKLPGGLVGVPIADLSVPFPYVHLRRANDDRGIVRSILGVLRRNASTPPSVDAVPLVPLRGGLASRLELRHLRYFVAVVEHGTIGRAAERMAMTQPGLSRQLRDLEDELGVSLLHRTKRGVEPTLAGQCLYDDAKPILYAAEHMKSEVERAVRAAGGRVVVGVVPTPLIWETITRAVATCAVRSPHIDVAVQDLPTPQHARSVREGRLDIGIGNRYPAATDLDLAVERSEILSDRLNLALVSSEHPLAGAKEIDLRSLRDVPFLFLRKTSSPMFHDLVMSTFARHGYVPKVDGEYDGLPTVWGLAAQGLGWCLGSSSQRQFLPRGLAAIRLRDFDLPWGAELVYAREETRAAVLEVLRAIEEAAREVEAAHASVLEARIA